VAEIFQNAKKSAAELCQILHMVTIELVIKSTRVMGVRMAISCRYCIAFEVMLSFLVAPHLLAYLLFSSYEYSVKSG